MTDERSKLKTVDTFFVFIEASGICNSFVALNLKYSQKAERRVNIINKFNCFHKQLISPS